MWRIDPESLDGVIQSINISSDDNIIALTNADQLHAIQSLSGEIYGSLSLGKEYASAYPATLSDTAVFFSSNLHSVYALEIVTEAIAWESDISGYPTTPPWATAAGVTWLPAQKKAGYTPFFLLPAKPCGNFNWMAPLPAWRRIGGKFTPLPARAFFTPGTPGTKNCAGKCAAGLSTSMPTLPAAPLASGTARATGSTILVFG